MIRDIQYNYIMVQTWLIDGVYSFHLPQNLEIGYPNDDDDLLEDVLNQSILKQLIDSNNRYVILSNGLLVHENDTRLPNRVFYPRDQVDLTIDFTDLGDIARYFDLLNERIDLNNRRSFVGKQFLEGEFKSSTRFSSSNEVMIRCGLDCSIPILSCVDTLGRNYRFSPTPRGQTYHLETVDRRSM